jgi:phosphatidylserine/phosphatidylglycerophosphate/cardiolipin synthase-like enzyme
MNKKIIILYLILSISALSLPAFADTKVYFSPDGGCQDAIISQINKAKKSIDVAMYNLTSREIAKELADANSRGVKVRVFMDEKAANGNKYAKDSYLSQSGIEVRYYRARKGIMHNKFAVIDNQVLITGSFNWTPTANWENEENLLIITDTDVVKQYSRRFENIWQARR